MTRALSVPADLAAALECEGLVARFDAFSPSHRNEYLVDRSCETAGDALRAYREDDRNDSREVVCLNCERLGYYSPITHSLTAYYFAEVNCGG